jgi:hypothetical protein
MPHFSNIPGKKGCGGIEAKDRITHDETLTNPRLHRWIEANVTERAQIQSRIVSFGVANHFPEIEVVSAVVCNETQKIFPLGSKSPGRQWYWTGLDQATAMVGDGSGNWADPDYHIVAGISGEMRQILERNISVQPFAEKLASRANYEEGQKLHFLWLNSTPFPPETHRDAQGYMGMLGSEPKPNAYFSVWCDPDNPTSAVTQLEYAMEHAPNEVKICLLGRDMYETGKMIAALNQSPVYRELGLAPLPFWLR